MTDKPKSIEEWASLLRRERRAWNYVSAYDLTHEEPTVDVLRAFADEIVERCFEKLKNKWEPNVSYMPSAIRDALDAVKKEIAG